MAFNFLVTRTGEEEDDALYPVLGDTDESIQLEDDDGHSHVELRASSVEVSRYAGNDSWQKTFQYQELKARVILTDSRLLFVCKKFEKGGGHFGFGAAGLLVATTANSISKARVRRRIRGKHLVAQCRHEWVRDLGIEVKQGLLSDNELHVYVVDDTGSRPVATYLQLVLHKREDMPTFAMDYANRVIKHRLRMKLSAEQRRELGATRDALQPLRPAIRELAYYKIPAHVPVKDPSSVD